jgi:NADH-quinone oxidoreductase subunit M
MASLGLPGLGNFVGEFLILIGTFQVHVWLAIVAAIGLVTAAIYALRLVQQTFHGPAHQGWRVPDLSARDLAVMAVMIASLVWLGLYPQPVFDTAHPALSYLQHLVDQRSAMGR